MTRNKKEKANCLKYLLLNDVNCKNLMYQTANYPKWICKFSLNSSSNTPIYDERVYCKELRGGVKSKGLFLFNPISCYLEYAIKYNQEMEDNDKFNWTKLIFIILIVIGSCIIFIIMAMVILLNTCLGIKLINWIESIRN